MDNRVKHYNGVDYYYDAFGNIVCRDAESIVQNFYYNSFHQLTRAEILERTGNNQWQKEIWVYEYDALHRRIQKARINLDGNKENITEFIWDGTRLLQEIYANGRYTYIYADQNSYEPLAQIHNWTNSEKATYQSINYFHCDQSGAPREMTDQEGNLLWYGEYNGLGQVSGVVCVEGTHQPFRRQNQYYDNETGLHYNLTRYYDPNFGRFITQDPIGLEGGSNAYTYAPNPQMWIDPLGLTGAYFMKNSFGNCYAGKGPLSRMNRSAKRFQPGDVYIDPATMKPTICVHRDFTDSPYPNMANEIGLMVEHVLISHFDAVDGGCFNKINSFGKRLLGDNLSMSQKAKYPVTDIHRRYAEQQAKEMIRDIKAGKRSQETKCPK